IQESTKTTNQREWETLGCYLSYFSRCREQAQKEELSFLSSLEILQKYNNQEATVNIYAVINNQPEKNGADNYVLSLQDTRNSFKLEISAADYHQNQEILVEHNELLFTCYVKVTAGKINVFGWQEAREL
ncbi:16643_t:CDS:1, partial [Racocetra persica]